MKNILLTIFILFLFMSCDLSKGEDNTNSTTETTATDGVETNRLVYDGNGVLLGTLLSGGSTTLFVMTSNNYIIGIHWDRSFHDGAGLIHSTELNGGGDLFLSNNVTIYGKTVYEVNGKLYSFKTVSNDIAVADTNITQYKSTYNNGSFTNSTASVSNGGFVLEEVSRTTVGIGNTITSPITIK